MDPRFPIGTYEPKHYTAEQKQRWLNDIQHLPRLLEQSVEQLDAFELDTPYRTGGWTIRQVVHHVADSHMNAFIRFKLALSEDNPTIKPYREEIWAEQADMNLPVNISITLLYALHQRWHYLLQHLTESDWERTVVHPQYGKTMTLWYMLGNYAWHGLHHVAHIQQAPLKK
jgi:hypothetical protein